MMYYNEEGDYWYNYSPNELAELSIRNRDKYENIVNSNLDHDDSIEKWENRNLERAKGYLKKS